jgi:K+-sensing histidine kinase KdpD
VGLSGDGQRPALRLAALRDGDQVRLEIGNAGPGFPAAAAERIGALFEQGDQTSLPDADYGPLLAIVKGTVELHRGRIQLSNDPELGCLFTIALPVSSGDV